MLLGMEGALRVSIEFYDTAWSGHLELEISVVWHRVVWQCVITAAKRDNIEY